MSMFESAVHSKENEIVQYPKTHKENARNSKSRKTSSKDEKYDEY